MKAVGPIDSLTRIVPESVVGTSGIAHTRWATHGAPTKENAHPHTDMSGTIILVHNGIIENFRELKEGLVVQGIRFNSDTDTEVLTKLIGTLYEGNLEQAVRRALQMVRGTYGIAVMSEKQPEQIVVARLGSPIVIGLAQDGNLIASDPSALLVHTKDVVYLEDGELAVVTSSGYQISAIAGAKRSRQPERIEWDIESVQKHGYDHFMLKEIMEAPEVIENTIRGRLLVERGRAKLGGLESYLDTLKSLERLVVVGCGSAYYAGLVGRMMLEEYAGLPVEVELGSEYRYKRNLPSPKSAVLAVTQSGETADTLASVRKAKQQGLLTLGVVNVVGSTIARETDGGVYNHAGPEVAVASTKAFLSQLTVMALLTLLIGRERDMTLATGTEIAQALVALPETIRTYLADTSAVAAVAKTLAPYRDVMYLGRKLHVPIAYEGALKLKEVTYVHAEAYAGGELKHGPIAMLGPDFPVVALVPKDDVYEKMISNLEEVRARKTPVIAIATVGDYDVAAVADHVLYVPKLHPILQPIISTIPLQLLAYYSGVARGLNVDRPRNLAKSVTVE
jgi:glucosamine--fructose-6-phosphate aminotransferase (isomerizing)